jgi:hypothetical protein
VGASVLGENYVDGPTVAVDIKAPADDEAPEEEDDDDDDDEAPADDEAPEEEDDDDDDEAPADKKRSSQCDDAFLAKFKDASCEPTRAKHRKSEVPLLRECHPDKGGTKLDWLVAQKIARAKSLECKFPTRLGNQTGD